MADNGDNNNHHDNDGRSTRWDERPLDPGDRRAFRSMRKDWEWYTTVLRLLKAVSLWGVGAAGAIWAGREVIGKILKALVQ